mgnify:CR=1 FL=1
MDVVSPGNGIDAPAGWATLDRHLAGRTVGLSFHLYIVAEGRVRISCRQGEQDLAPGRAALLPACLGDYRLETLTPQALLLKVNLPE